jgi:hypothetical protein
MKHEQLTNFNGKIYFFCLPRGEGEKEDQFQHLLMGRETRLAVFKF